jgi:hypothetical protein
MKKSWFWRVMEAHWHLEPSPSVSKVARMSYDVGFRRGRKAGYKAGYSAGIQHARNRSA